MDFLWIKLLYCKIFLQMKLVYSHMRSYEYHSIRTVGDEKKCRYCTAFLYVHMFDRAITIQLKDIGKHGKKFCAIWNEKKCLFHIHSKVYYFYDNI